MMVKAPGSSFAKVKPPSNIGWSSKRKFARAQTTDVSKRGRSWPEMKKLSWCSESLSAQKTAEARVKHRVQENGPSAKTVWVKDGTLLKIKKTHKSIKIDVVQKCSWKHLCFWASVCVCHIFVHIYTFIPFIPVYMLKLSSPDESPQLWDPPHCGWSAGWAAPTPVASTWSLRWGQVVGYQKALAMRKCIRHMTNMTMTSTMAIQYIIYT